MYRTRQQSSTTRPIVILLLDSEGMPVIDVDPYVEISKNGGEWEEAAGAVTEIGQGVYWYAGHATDRDTLGTLMIKASVESASYHTAIEIVPYDVFARVDANVSGWRGNDVPAPDTNGYPKVTIKSGTGTGELNITGGALHTVTNLTNLPAMPNNWVKAPGIEAEAITSSKFASGLYSAVDGGFSANVKGVSGTLVSDPWAVPGDAMTLTAGERTATATEVESHLLDEGDSQMLINAIVGAIGNTNLDEASVVAAIRADMERDGGAIDTIQTTTDALAPRLPGSGTLSTYAGADTSGTTTLLSRLTSDRAGYLDKLNVAGTLANTNNADTFKADVSGLLTAAVFTAMTTGTGTDRKFTATALEDAPAGGGGGGGTGNGDIAVNHNYGGTDALRIITGGDGVDDVLISAWEVAQYASGTKPKYQTRTGSDGRWTAPLMLDAGSYVVIASKPGKLSVRLGSGSPPVLEVADAD